MKKCNSRRAVASLIMALAASGCATQAATKEDGEKALPRASTPAIAVLSDQCPLTEIGSSESLVSVMGIGLVQAFAPAVIGYGYDLVVKALEARADALTASTSTSARSTLYIAEDGGSGQGAGQSFRPKSRCLVVIRGGFEPVSYTHLDVYKRQTCWRARKPSGSTGR